MIPGKMIQYNIRLAIWNYEMWSQLHAFHVEFFFEMNNLIYDDVIKMETFSALLAICAGNSPVMVNSPHKG